MRFGGPSPDSRSLPRIGAIRFYAAESSFVCGFKWMNGYIGDDEETLKLAADGFGAEMIHAKCTVAHSAAPGRLSRRRPNYRSVETNGGDLGSAIRVKHCVAMAAEREHKEFPAPNRLSGCAAPHSTRGTP